MSCNSPSDIKVIKRVAAQHETWQEAVKAISKALGRTETRWSIKHALSMAQEKTLGKLLKVSNKTPPAWCTDQTFAKIKSVAAECVSKSQVAEAVSKIIGRPVSYNAIDTAVSRNFNVTLYSLLNKSISTPSDMLAKRALQDRADRAEAQLQQVLDELKDANRRQDFLDTISVNAPPRILPREKKSGLREMSFCVLASDWHVEETVDPEQVAGRNEYSLEIAKKRIRRLFDGIVWNVEHQRASKRIAIRDGVLWLGGDHMSGYIHEELIEGNALSPIETVIWLKPLICDGIHTILERLDLASLMIPCSHGNHGKTAQGKPKIATAPENNFEWLMFHQIRDTFKDDKRVRFEITRSAHQYVDVYGRTIHFHHGDSLKYSGGVGGLGIPLLKAVPAWNDVRRADLHCVGHWHQQRDYRSVLVNGSLIGYGPYSSWIRAPFEEPMQTMFYMDKVRGRSMVTDLWVEESRKT
jgi:hypothetical protein